MVICSFLLNHDILKFIVQLVIYLFYCGFSILESFMSIIHKTQEVGHHSFGSCNSDIMWGFIQDINETLQ